MKANNTAGKMRLSREARAARKDIESAIKKDGKIKDSFICLPDPEDPYTWYYIVFDLDHKDFKGGFYMGKIVCPPDYPAKAPKVCLVTKNGMFHTWEDGICLSISSYHPESWNPVWKVNQIVIGLVSFWVADSEYTYGAVEKYEAQREFGDMKDMKDWRIKLAKESKKLVMEHPKFEIFKEYAHAIGINDENVPDSWLDHEKRYAEVFAKRAEEKRIAEEKKAAEEAAAKAEAERLAKLEAIRLAQEAEAERKAKEKAEKEAKMTASNKFFKKLAKLDLTKLIGQPLLMKAAIKANF